MNKATDLILVTGATGRQGGAIAKELLAKGYKVRAMTRHPDGQAARAIAKLGAEVVAGDLDDAGSVRKAVTGAWGVFSVQNSWETGVEREEVQGKGLAGIAREGGVQHFVYSSVASAHRSTGIPHFESKWHIEETVRGLGFPSFTIIRPVFFMENLLSPSFLPSIQEGNLAIAIKPETRLQMIAVEDIGQHGSRAFERHAELKGQAFDIAGDALTMPETAAILSKVSGRAVRFVQVPIDAVRNMSADTATMLEWFDRVGYDVDIPRLVKASGIPATRFAAWAPTADWVPAPAAR